MRYYTNGVNEKRFNEDDIIPEGWVLGRLKSPVTTQGCMWINNGHEAKFINKNDPIPSGWQKGRLKSHLNPEKCKHTWETLECSVYTNGIDCVYVSKTEKPPAGFTKGRPPMSDEQKQKLSASHKGLHHSEEAKRKISLHSNNNREKAYQTIIDRYGSFDSYHKMILSKANNTKSKNGTFNTSNPEKYMYKTLCEQYGKHNVIRQYKDDRYPFYCDFYIKSEDLFIELNAHWTHGGKPFDPADSECEKQLLEWKEKAKVSQYYATAINTWTVRDVEKSRVAKNNNLNYKVIY